jgi:ribose 5-phosphate isomerase B
MRIAFGADDENETTAAVRARITEAGHQLVPVDAPEWPEIGAYVGEAVAGGHADLGVVMCWTGTGVSIAANKVPGVRAALAWEAWIADGARRWNDANVLALSLKRLAPAVAVEVLDAFLAPEGPDPDEVAATRRLEAGTAPERADH